MSKGTSARGAALRAWAAKKAESYRPETQVRQVRALQKAYAGDKGPDLLVFGDSVLVWAAPNDADRRSLIQMVADGLGGTSVHTIVGPCYNPRIVMAFLEVLRTSRSRPKAVIVPTSVMMATEAWGTHPIAGYIRESPAIVEIAQNPGDKRRTIPHATPEDWEEWDRKPAPSLIGQKRTNGEQRFLFYAIPAYGTQLPTTKWQTLVRLRQMTDFTNAERLEPDSPGVLEITELAERLDELGLPGVGYIPPCNYEVVYKLLRADAEEHLKRNSQIVVDAFHSPSGHTSVVDGTFNSPQSEFGDPIHVSEKGRLRLAERFVTELLPYFG